MSFGNERFSQYLATSNLSLDLNQPSHHDMAPFSRKYAKYINNKAYSYRVFGADFARLNKRENRLKTMSGEELLKTLPLLQQLVDSLLDLNIQERDLRNGVLTAAFVLLYRDLIRLFAVFNDGVINLLDKFFSFKQKEARAALDLYKKFLVRMDRVSDLFRTAEAVGVDRGDVPDLTRAPSSLLEALEAHCLALEGKQEDVMKRALEEEEQVLANLKRERQQERQQARQEQDLLVLDEPFMDNKKEILALFDSNPFK